MDAAAGWAAAEMAELRRLWREFLPVWAIAGDLGRKPKQVQAMVRALDLPHRDPAAVARAERARRAAAALRRARAAAEQQYPVALGARDAAELAVAYGIAWRGRRADLAALNAALDQAGHRPVFVPFRELRP